MCVILMGSLPWETWFRLVIWLAVGLLIYLCYGRHHSHLGKELRGEIAAPRRLARRNAAGRRGPRMSFYRQ